MSVPRLPIIYHPFPKLECPSRMGENCHKSFAREAVTRLTAKASSMATAYANPKTTDYSL